MSELECLVCYEKLDIPEYVDTEEFDGEMVCKNCGTRLAIKFNGSEKPVKYKVSKESASMSKKLIDLLEEIRKNR